MKINKALSREAKIFKKKHGMRVSNRSIFLLDRISSGIKRIGK